MNLLFRRLNTNLFNYLIIKSHNNKQFSSKTLNAIKNIRNENIINNNKCLNELKTIRTITTTTQINLFQLKDNIYIQKRFKKGKKGSKNQKQEESSDEESDEELEQSGEEDPDLIDGKAIDFKDMNLTITSLRLDNVAKVGLTMARNRVEETFYGNLFRLNGEKVDKKSVELVESDELDYIRGSNPDNPNLIDVTRVVIKEIEDKMSTSGRIRIKLRKFPRLTIPNYPNEPYDGFALSTSRPDRKANT